MTTSAATWVEAAYNRSTSNDPGKLASDAELLDHLNRVYQRLYSLYARARPNEAASVTTITLTGATASATLPTDTIDLVALRNALGAVVHVIPFDEIGRLWHLAPSVARVGLTIRSRAATGDPITGDILTAMLLDAPASLTSLSSVVDPRFPTRHHQIVVDGLARYLDTKDDGRDSEGSAKLVAEHAQALASFASEFGLPPSAVEWAHAPADRSGVPGG